jgi:hypothetical protein
MLGGEVDGSRPAEPERLLEGKKYRAAVISAMSLLEARLRERPNKTVTSGPESDVDAIAPQSAREQQLLTDPTAVKLDGWMRIRNEIVHSSEDVSRAQTTEIVMAGSVCSLSFSGSVGSYPAKAANNLKWPSDDLP